MAVSVPTIFRECHRLRRHLRELKEEIERGPRVLQAEQARLAAAEQAHKDAYDTIKQLKLKQKEEESLLKTFEANLAKLFQRSMEVTTMKEMEATRHETEHTTAKKSSCEDAILSAILEIEERTADLPNVEKRWADAQKEFAEFQVDAKDRLERMLADQKECQAKLVQWEDQLPEDVRSLYDRLVKSYGPDGLAEVKGRACTQCRTQMTEDKRDILASGKFLTCSNCGRGLYLAE
jgi:predicted  nucleic acid-binding Zn-ribbon protein